jgi:ubiquinone/menaquinone biosynthesis C-methylase UbiE
MNKFLFKVYKATEKAKEEELKKALQEIPANKTLLDIGSWDGRKTLWWAQAAKTQKVTGLELVPQEAEKARKRGIKTYVCDIDHDKWPIKNNSVDCVMSNLVIEHLTDVDHFISESYRVLKKGGYMIVSTNNLSSWHNIGSLLFGWAPLDLTNSSTKAWSIGNPFVTHPNAMPGYGKTFCHKCVYTAKWLKDWYELYKFKLVDIKGSGYYPLPPFLGNIDKTHAAYIILTFRK